MSFILRAYDVSVDGYDTVQFFAASPGRARWRAYRAFGVVSSCSFAEFLARSSIRRALPHRAFGELIIVGGERAYRAGPERHDVPFVRDDSDVVLYSHPSDVLPAPPQCVGCDAPVKAWGDFCSSCERSLTVVLHGGART